MTGQIHTLAQQLFNKSTVEECTLEEVQDLARRYPYFVPAQFLLLEKLKSSGSSEYETQLQKAVLYYHDPLEFEYFISSDRFYTEYNFEEIVVEEPVAVEAGESSEMPSPSEAAPVIPEISTTFESNIDIPAFEPYHTVDYFASQGIKLKQEEIPIDKFGKQLKSFTEWLRSMKKLPGKEIMQNLDSTLESNVQHLAEDSIHEADIVTESMAEVWLKQGNREKALEVYNKLSLQNPSKRAYFAAKIDNLKNK
jgi:hypothetical protein